MKKDKLWWVVRSSQQTQRNMSHQFVLPEPRRSQTAQETLTFGGNMVLITLDYHRRTLSEERNRTQEYLDGLPSLNDCLEHQDGEWDRVQSAIEDGMTENEKKNVIAEFTKTTHSTCAKYSEDYEQEVKALKDVIEAIDTRIRDLGELMEKIK